MFLLMQSGTLTEHPLWEVFKGILLFATTAMMTWSATTLRQVLKSQQKHDIMLVGIDGENGLRQAVRHHEERLDAIEQRNQRIDTIVAEQERERWPHPERRHHTRRAVDLRDPQPPSTEEE